MNTEYINQAKAYGIIRMLGILQLLIGFSSLFIAPVEIYCFYLFSDGGTFHYDGFGIGSFLHVLISAQIFALYAIALLLILIGYGHLKLKSWTLNLSIASIRFWIIFGLPFMVFFLPLLTTKEINTRYPFLLISFAALLLIIVIPGLLLFFYNQKNVRKLFLPFYDQGLEYEIIPVSNLLAILVYSTFILLFHIMIFFHGMFPLLGRFISGLNGIIIYSCLIILMGILIYGLIKKLFYTWIISVALLSFIALSAIITFLRYNYSDIIDLLDLPKPEKDIFMNLPMKSAYLLIPITCILVVSLIIIFRTKRNYKL